MLMKVKPSFLALWWKRKQANTKETTVFAVIECKITISFWSFRGLSSRRERNKVVEGGKIHFPGLKFQIPVSLGLSYTINITFLVSLKIKKRNKQGPLEKEIKLAV